MSSEESEFEDEQDPITGETSTKLASFVTRKLPWERTNFTNAKMRLDRAHQKNLTPHVRQMTKPRRVGGHSDSLDLVVQLGLSGLHQLPPNSLLVRALVALYV